MTKPKHISKMKASDRVKFDQDIRDILLAIVISQGKPVTLSMDVARMQANNHRLIFEWQNDTVTGAEFVTMSIEKAEQIILPKTPKIIQ